MQIRIEIKKVKVLFKGHKRAKSREVYEAGSSGDLMNPIHILFN